MTAVIMLRSRLSVSPRSISRKLRIHRGIQDRLARFRRTRCRGSQIGDPPVTSMRCSRAASARELAHQRFLADACARGRSRATAICRSAAWTSPSEHPDPPSVRDAEYARGNRDRQRAPRPARLPRGCFRAAGQFVDACRSQLSSAGRKLSFGLLFRLPASPVRYAPASSRCRIRCCVVASRCAIGRELLRRRNRVAAGCRAPRSPAWPEACAMPPGTSRSSPESLDDILLAAAALQADHAFGFQLPDHSDDLLLRCFHFVDLDWARAPPYLPSASRRRAATCTAGM